MEAQRIAVRLRHRPARFVRGQREPRGGARGHQRGEQHGGDDRQRGVNRLDRAVIHIQALHEMREAQRQHAHGDLTQQVAGHGADHRVDAGLRHEHEEDMVRRDPHRVVDVDLVFALVDGTAHGIEHRQRGDEQRDEQLDETGEVDFVRVREP